MNTESLIFDIDGTLWDSRARVAEGYNIQLKAEGLDHLCVTKDDLTPLFGKVMTAIADSILASVPKEARYGMMQRLMDTENEHLVRMPCDFGYPNVKQTMERLSKKHRLFIVSNSQCGYPDICIEKLGLTGLIEGHLCFGDTGTEKGETIRRLMKEHKIQSAAYIGDTQGDLDAAAAAGIPFIFASYGFGNPTHWDAKIEKFEDLLAL
ncbi:MAG: HAD family hydrolase [Oscillospiraceae bacterium]|nr:HAD family hydrolase [Oscillospiraceae bacterium]